MHGIIHITMKTKSISLYELVKTTAIKISKKLVYGKTDRYQLVFRNVRITGFVSGFPTLSKIIYFEFKFGDMWCSMGYVIIWLSKNINKKIDVVIEEVPENIFEIKRDLTYLLNIL